MSKQSKHFYEAKRVKNDEFYTRYEDIEKELKNYLNCFKDKVVYCNCDDYRVSNFVKYFVDNFKTLGLKKLVSTCYIDQQIDLLSFTTPEPALYFEFDGVNKVVKPLNQDGDFRSEECLNILKQCDIVVTNPPFSIFREYVDTLINSDKKFLIIGPVGSIHYKQIFEHLKTELLTLGYNRVNKFISGDSVTDVASIWFTNLEVKKEFKLNLTKHYDPELYPKYDNYDAINVNKTSDIPCDYKGLMGVPLTVFEKFDMNNFEVLGLLRPYLNGKSIYIRILIKLI